MCEAKWLSAVGARAVPRPCHPRAPHPAEDPRAEFPAILAPAGDAYPRRSRLRAIQSPAAPLRRMSRFMASRLPAPVPPRGAAELSPTPARRFRAVGGGERAPPSWRSRNSRSRPRRRHVGRGKPGAVRAVGGGMWCVTTCDRGSRPERPRRRHVGACHFLSCVSPNVRICPHDDRFRSVAGALVCVASPP